MKITRTYSDKKCDRKRLYAIIVDVIIEDMEKNNYFRTEVIEEEHKEGEHDGEIDGEKEHSSI